MQRISSEGSKADLPMALSRRRFLTAALASGLSLAMAQVMWSRKVSAEPQKGGRLRAGLAHGSTTDTLDPATYENGFTQTMGNSVYNRLTEVGPTGELIGELAETWEPTSDAKTWRFKLRSGVSFHNGMTFTSADVSASINHHRGEGSKSGAKAIVAEITELKADGPNARTVTLKRADAGVPVELTNSQPGI